MLREVKRRSASAERKLRAAQGVLPQRCETFQVRAERVGQIGPRQRELHRGLEEAELLAGVVPLALELDGVDRAAGREACGARW